MTDAKTIVEVKAEGEEAASRALATHPEAKRLRYAIEQAEPYVAKVLPEGMGARRQIEIAIGVVMRSKTLQGCNPVSMVRCIQAASELGLEFGESRQEAHLVPFKGECKLIPGWRGYLKLARQSGEIDLIRTAVVRARDQWSGITRTATGDDFAHVAYDGDGAVDDATNPVRGVYCAATMKSGRTVVEWMAREDVDKIMKRSQGYQYAKREGRESPWLTDWTEMARKTVVRRAAKSWPQSDRLDRARQFDDDFDRLSTDVANGDAAREKMRALPAKEAK